ncbi:hypothetical protein Pla22_21270 [Rubripirellula amarantea]|uniref:Uncharacterized protein n=1 Tax=Rubripirellula amarantea TaxID=2527999 RepID=A0A5C5WVB4_9BACT|nr:hypothetical protein Pla22_21270 [Rubripirellula amarantea]
MTTPMRSVMRQRLCFAVLCLLIVGNTSSHAACFLIRNIPCSEASPVQDSSCSATQCAYMEMQGGGYAYCAVPRTYPNLPIIVAKAFPSDPSHPNTETGETKVKTPMLQSNIVYCYEYQDCSTACEFGVCKTATAWTKGHPDFNAQYDGGTVCTGNFPD